MKNKTLALKRLFSESDHFNKKPRTLLLRPLISFVVSWTQSVTESNDEMKQLRPMLLTQGPISHHYFWEGGQARFPALSFSPHSTYSRWGSLLWQYLSCRWIRPPLNSGLMTIMSEAGQFSAFGNSLPSFFNHEWATEKHHACANMGKVKQLELWWQLYITWLPERDVRNNRPMDFSSTECTRVWTRRTKSQGCSTTWWQEWMNGMDEWMNEWMNKWMYVCACKYVCTYVCMYGRGCVDEKECNQTAHFVAVFKAHKPYTFLVLHSTPNTVITEHSDKYLPWKDWQQ